MSFFLVLGASVIGFAMYSYGKSVRQEDSVDPGVHTETNFQSPSATMQLRDGYKCKSTHRYDPVRSYSKTSGHQHGVTAPAWACHTDTGATIITYTKPLVGGYVGGNH